MMNITSRREFVRPVSHAFTGTGRMTPGTERPPPLRKAWELLAGPPVFSPRHVMTQSLRLRQRRQVATQARTGHHREHRGGRRKTPWSPDCYATGCEHLTHWLSQGSWGVRGRGQLSGTTTLWALQAGTVLSMSLMATAARPWTGPSRRHSHKHRFGLSL